jgi:hypothetical protein
MASFDFGKVSAYRFAFAGNVTANVNTGTVDTQGFEGLAVVHTVGTSNLSDTKNLTISFFESDLSNGSGATSLSSNFVKGTTFISNVTNSTFWTSVKPSKRYVFARYVVGGSAVSANVQAVVALGFPSNAPTY